MKKRFNILFLCLCLTLSFGIILLASSQLTYASNGKDNKKAKGDRSKKKNKKKRKKSGSKKIDSASKSKKGGENVAPIDKHNKGAGETLGTVGTIEYINNAINKLAGNSVNANLSFNYSAWYTADTDYLLDGVVDYNFSDNVISFSGYIYKGTMDNKEDVSFYKKYGNDFKFTTLNEDSESIVKFIVGQCEFFTEYNIVSSILSYFKTTLGNDKLRFNKDKNTYYLDKPDKSLVVAKLSKSNTLALAQRYIKDNFVDRIEKFEIGVDSSYEKSNTGDKLNNDNSDGTDDASLDDFYDSSFESNDDDFNDPFFNS
jgi:hypothetical protein